jgi:pimeloyl-ACP methyl ester carboxylesterase
MGPRLVIACAALAGGVSLALAALLLSGGGVGSPAKVIERSYGHGADRVWIFRPEHGKPKHVVLFVHGLGDQLETTPVHHQAWLEHLAREGNAVLYPRFELHPAAPEPLRHLLAGARLGWKQLGVDAPVLAIGYSRGGALAVEYAAASAGNKVPVPDVVESINTVSRGEQSRLTDLRPLRHDTVLSIIASDQDELGVQGARLLLRRLHGAGFPGKQIQLHFAHSHGSFVADHVAPLGGSPAAHKAYWAPTDALLRQLSA